MKRDEVLRILTEHRQEIAGYGVKSLAVFGSVARDEAGPDSDIDVLIEVERPFGLFKLLDVEEFLEHILGQPVDVVTPNGLRPEFRETILREAIRAA
jgi:predicted nucleotidyltransferase